MIRCNDLKMIPREEEGGKFRPNLQQSRVIGTRITDEAHSVTRDETETHLPVEMQQNHLKKEKYCTDETRCRGGDYWTRVWNRKRYASLMGWPRKDALNGEGRSESGHNPFDPNYLQLKIDKRWTLKSQLAQ